MELPEATISSIRANYQISLSGRSAFDNMGEVITQLTFKKRSKPVSNWMAAVWGSNIRQLGCFI